VAAPSPLPPQETDLLVTPFYQADDWGTVDLVAFPAVPQPGDTPDLAVATSGNSLRQALLLRLLTPLGALSPLGHANYGSRLYELIGNPNTPQARRLARSFVLQAVAQEQRVASVLDLEVQDPDQFSIDRLKIFLRVQPATQLDPVALGIEVAL
jgi:phage baseplate assembly protein W